MERLLTILSTLAALLGITSFIHPRSRSKRALLWLPKLVGGALAPVSGLVGASAALVGLTRRKWILAGAGLLGAGLAARLLADLPDAGEALAGLAGSGAAGATPSGPSGGRPSPALEQRPAATADVLCDVAFGHDPQSGRSLLADLWLPPADHRSGLGLIYAHGSGWRLGDKDMGTRPFFRRLVAQGHVVLDVGYTLWPTAELPAMVAELNQAILWLKEHGAAYGVRPDRIVMMGGSAGGHLALLAAYTPGHPAFRPPGASGDTSVCGVVAFYPPVDLLAMQAGPSDDPPQSSGLVDRIGQAMLRRLFTVHEQNGSREPSDDLLSDLLGGTAAEIPDTYRLLSPIQHVGSHCPPTLLLQGSDDVFGLAPGVRRLHERLCGAGVPVALLEFPHTEHAFDLMLPRISPTARAATRAVEQFLARLPDRCSVQRATRQQEF